MEAELLRLADAVYEGIVDLSVDSSTLDSRWEQLRRTRHQLMVMTGMPVQPYAPAMGYGQMDAVYSGWQDGGAAETPAEPISWKQKLLEAVTKRNKGGLAKGDFVYETVDDPSGGYYSTISSQSNQLTASYSSQTMAKSKRDAEQEAAMIALQSEFPEFFNQLNYAGQPNGQTGKKRKLAEVPADPMNPKSKLTASLFLLLERNPAKDDMTFDTNEVDGGFTSTLTMPNYDPTSSWHGQGANRKEAETAACDVALTELAPTLEPLQQAHKEKKARLNREKLGEMKEKLQAKKMAKDNASVDQQAAVAE